MATAISDLGVMLFTQDPATGIYKYLVPVTAAPATGGSPSNIEVTELDSEYKQNVPDRPETPNFEFDYNYTASNYKTVKAKFDGTSVINSLLVYQDKSGFAFTGIGATWTDAISRGSAVGGKLAIAVTKKDWVETVTATVAYKVSTDTSIVDGKIYFTKAGEAYTKVAAPTGNPSTSSYYELDGYIVDKTSIPAGKYNPYTA